jgi:hypothetical protein
MLPLVDKGRVLYSTYLDIGERFKPSNAELLAAKHATAAAETVVE